MSKKQCILQVLLTNNKAFTYKIFTHDQKSSKPTSIINYNSIFQSLQSRYDFKSTKKTTNKTIYFSQAQYNILDSSSCKDFSFPPKFTTFAEANAYVRAWKKPKKTSLLKD